MHEGTADKIAASLDTIAKCLLIVVDNMPKLAKADKASIADIKDAAAGSTPQPGESSAA